MKKITLFTAVFMSLFAMDASAARNKPKKVTLDALVNSFQEARGLLQGPTDCKFSVDHTAMGTVLTVETPEKRVSLRVSSSSVIMLSEQTESDGSFYRVFRIPLVGSFTFTRLDDAYDRAYLSNGGTTVDCESDF